MVMTMVFQISWPVTAWALTSGPTQPEVQTFEPVGSTQMVDLFSGDFTYNIPLLEVPGPNGGYPVNLFYNSVTDAETEASMVGLGWNIGIGAVTTNVRGVPDSFKGDKIENKTDMKPNWTLGLGTRVGLGIEFGGGDLEKALNLGISSKYLYNSYKGFGYSFEPSAGIKVSGDNMSSTLGMGLSVNSLEGASMNGNVSMSRTKTSIEGTSVTQRTNTGSLGFGMSARGGMKSLTMGGGQSTSSGEVKFIPSVMGSGFGFGISGAGSRSGAGGSSSYSFSLPSYMPSVANRYTGGNVSLDMTMGGDTYFGDFSMGMNGFFQIQKLADKNKWVDAPAYGFMHSEDARTNEESIMDFSREKDGPITEGMRNLYVPFATPDIISVAGHGTGGSYLTQRSDFGGLFLDPAVEYGTSGFQMGVEFAGGTGLKIGANTGLNSSSTESHRPKDPIGNHGFKEKENGSGYEPFYMKAASDITADLDWEDNLANMGGDSPMSLNIQGGAFFEAGDIASAAAELANPFNSGLIPMSDFFGKRFGDTYRVKGGSGFNPGSVSGKMEKRKPKSSPILTVTNGMLKNAESSTTRQYNLSEYNVDYHTILEGKADIGETDYAGGGTGIDRSDGKDSHIAGYTSLTPNGARWVYGLPVMNNVQYDVTFSVEDVGRCDKTVSISSEPETNPKEQDVDGYKIRHDFPNTRSEDYLNVKKTPGHAYSHLLTSVLGADYIDRTDDGVSDDDYGYWMKVEYVKTSDNYIWKTPFFGANALRGHASKRTDDKGTYTTGSREQFYPARIVTNTHEARFIYERRDDARGAYNMVQNSDVQELGDYSYKLTEIRLYSRASDMSVPMKTVHFAYSADELCRGVHNNGTAQGGKLTLESVHFTYRNNGRGSLTPYVFEYDGLNSPYDEFAYDRWGTYRDSGSPDTECDHVYDPYTEQKDTDHKDNVANWHITGIRLPSGSSIKLDLGRDHYGYVQDRVATQMFKIAAFEDGIVNGIPDATIYNDKSTYTGGNPEQGNDNVNMRVYFELEEPTDSPSVLDAYFEDLYEFRNDNGNIVRQMYYKLNVNLTEHDNDLWKENVEGYVDIRSYHFDETSLDQGSGLYSRAYVELDRFPIENRGDYYHPMVIGNWQYLKTNLTDMMYGDMGDAPEGSNENAIIQAVGRFLATLGEIRGMISSYYEYCHDKGYGVNVDLDKSFIRLNSPDKKKYGGGVRVEKVEMSDGYWESETGEPTPEYGVVYEYDMVENYYDHNRKAYVEKPGGRMVSSGVATNEPMVGAEECALKYAKNYTNDVRGGTNEYFYFEYPVNESLYPGPSIGYGRVTVKSLATDLAMRMAEEGEDFDAGSGGYDDQEEGFAASGVTVNEFFTARDFPVVVDETPIDTRDNSIKWIPIPLVGQLTFNYLTASQGYSIELNDMHGKPRKNSSYGLDTEGNLIPDPVSWTEYHYLEKDGGKNYSYGETSYMRRVLDNHVDVIISDDFENLDANRALGVEMGVDRQLFTDMRHVTNTSASGGMDVNVNLEWFPPNPIPAVAVFPWPSIGLSDDMVRTSVSNKYVRRSGILHKVVAFDGQSTIETENRLFDPMTGQALLTTVNNLYDDPIYSYNIPARFAYDGMGEAYENLGLEFVATVEDPSVCGSDDNIEEHWIMSPASMSVETQELLSEGDEFLISYDNGNHATKATLIEINAGVNRIAIEDAGALSSGSGYSFMIVRSGKRNHLSASVGSITSLDDPTIERNLVNDCGHETIIHDVVPGGGCQVHPAFEAYIDLLNSLMSHNEIEDTPDLIDYFDAKISVGSGESYEENALSLFGVQPYQEFLNIINAALDSEELTEFAVAPYPYGNSGMVPILFDPQGDCILNFADCVPPGISIGNISVPAATPMNPNNANSSMNILAEGISGISDVQVYHNGNDITSEFSYDSSTGILTGEIPSMCEGNNFIQVVAGNACGIASDSEMVSFGEDGNCPESSPNPIITGTGQQTYIDFQNAYIEDYDCEEGTVTFSVRVKTGDIITQTVSSIGTGGCSIPVLQTTDIPMATETPVAVTSALRGLDNVLQASAVTFSDDWAMEGETECLESQTAGQSMHNPYADGNSGIWRLHETYAYVEQRSQDSQSDDPFVDLRYDGTFPLEMFNWEDPASHECTDRWRKVEEVTKYGVNGAAIESRDALGIYSSALYGYNNHLPIAVAANAGYYEVGYDGFEEYDEDLSNTGRKESGHLRFLEGCAEFTEVEQTNQINVYMPYNVFVESTGYGNSPYVMAPELSQDIAGTLVGAKISFVANEIDYGNGTVTLRNISGTITETVDLPPHLGHPQRTMILYEFDCDSDQFEGGGLTSFCDVLSDNVLVDFGSAYSSEESGTSSGYVGIDNLDVVPRPHTGSKSLKVSGLASIPQDYLGLQEGREYVISAWVHVNAGGNLRSFGGHADIRFGNAELLPKGNVIDGWQRMEAVFEYGGNNNLVLDTPEDTPFWMDDIRVFPSDGNIQTYVYDPVDYRVTEILDNNNFFTRYDYDSEGNVVSVSKETAEGVKTIQEAGSHIRPNN